MGGLDLLFVYCSYLLFVYRSMQWIPRSLGIILALGDFHPEQIAA